LFTFCKARWAREKEWKDNHATKVTKIPKTKTQKYGMNETLFFDFMPGNSYTIIILETKTNCGSRIDL
jgi:hypothetical protein